MLYTMQYRVYITPKVHQLCPTLPIIERRNLESTKTTALPSITACPQGS